jgi:hypothetical protein
LPSGRSPRWFRNRPVPTGSGRQRSREAHSGETRVGRTLKTEERRNCIALAGRPAGAGNS